MVLRSAPLHAVCPSVAQLADRVPHRGVHDPGDRALSSQLGDVALAARCVDVADRGEPARAPRGGGGRAEVDDVVVGGVEHVSRRRLTGQSRGERLDIAPVVRRRPKWRARDGGQIRERPPGARIAQLHDVTPAVAEDDPGHRGPLVHQRRHVRDRVTVHVGLDGEPANPPGPGRAAVDLLDVAEVVAVHDANQRPLTREVGEEAERIDAARCAGEGGEFDVAPRLARVGRRGHQRRRDEGHHDGHGARHPCGGTGRHEGS